MSLLQGPPTFFNSGFGSSILTGIKSIYSILKPRINDILQPIVNAALSSLPDPVNKVINFVVPFIRAADEYQSVLQKRDALDDNGQEDDIPPVRKKRRRN